MACYPTRCSMLTHRQALSGLYSHCTDGLFLSLVFFEVSSVSALGLM